MRGAAVPLTTEAVAPASRQQSASRPTDAAIGLLALQRTAGNRAVAALLAPAPGIARRRGAELVAVQRHQAPTAHTHPPQWENPDLVATIYTRRADMMRFVIEQMASERAQRLRAARGTTQSDALRELRAGMQRRLAELRAAPPPVAMVPANARPGAEERARQQAEMRRTALITRLESMLQGERLTVQNATRFLRSGAGAGRGEETMLTAGLALDELNRRAMAAMGAESLPQWAVDIINRYGGMRYQSAHGSWYPARYLVALVELHDGEHPDARIVPLAPGAAAPTTPATTRGGRGRGQRPAAVQPTLDEAAALARIEAWHQAGHIPAPAWQAIVQFTELRTSYATAAWESIGSRLPPELTGPWRDIVARWRRDNTTGWRGAVQGSPERMIVTRIVCNELAEHILARFRIRVPGGISANADWFYQRSVSQHGATGGVAPQAQAGPAATQDQAPPSPQAPTAAAAAVEQLAPDLVPPATEPTAEGGTASGTPPRVDGAAPGGETQASLPEPGQGPEIVGAGADGQIEQGDAAPTQRPPPTPVPPTTVDGTGHRVPASGQQLTTPAAAVPTEPFFKHGPDVAAADLVEGAQLFFVDREWSLVPATHATVRPVPGVTYHVPPATHGGPAGPAITEGLEHEGWTYHVSSDFISRSRTTPLPAGPRQDRPAGEGRREPRTAPPPTPEAPRIEYMKWSHQATVIRVAGDGRRVLTIETTANGAGLGTRNLADLQRPYVFVGWAPAGTRGGAREGASEWNRTITSLASGRQ